MKKFDFVIGNPPYQETVSKTESQTQGNSNWIYQHFQFAADKISNFSCLVYPFGGWFDAPDRLNNLGNTILKDHHTIKIDAYEGTTDKRAWYRTDKKPNPLFGENANLSAGVSIIVRSCEKTLNSYKFSNRVYTDNVVEVNIDDADFLTPNPDFQKINHKLGNIKLNSSIKKGVFGIESDFVEKNPDKVSKNKRDWSNPIQILTNDKAGSTGRATWFWTDENIIEKGSEYLNMYKIITTSAYPKQKFSSGTPTVANVHKRLGELIELLPPKTAIGNSRLLIFSSANKKECENYLKYTQTEFFAGLILQEPNRRSSFGYIIPMQDFTEDSDIDWNKSIDDINKQLYRKYNFSEDEIKYLKGGE